MNRSRDSAWTVLAAALALVAHLFIAGAANAALAGSPDFVICGGISHRTAPDQPRDHSQIPGCCLAGCSTVAGAAAVPRLPVLPVRVRGPEVAAELPARAVHVDSHERSPTRARGPPGSA